MSTDATATTIEVPKHQRETRQTDVGEQLLYVGLAIPFTEMTATSDNRTRWQRVIELARNVSTKLWEHTDDGVRCRICQKEIVPKHAHKRTSLAFPMTSHAKMHVRAGEAWSPYGIEAMGTQAFVVPTDEAILEEMNRTVIGRARGETLERLVAERKSLREQLATVRKHRQDRENFLLAQVRIAGAYTIVHDVELHQLADFIRDEHQKEMELRKQLDAIAAKYPASVVDQLRNAE